MFWLIIDHRLSSGGRPGRESAKHQSPSVRLRGRGRSSNTRLASDRYLGHSKDSSYVIFKVFL